MDAKKGCSALQLQRHLGLGSYESAWYMVHRIRKSMVDPDAPPLTGTVEMDETYIGPRPKAEMVMLAPKNVRAIIRYGRGD